MKVIYTVCYKVKLNKRKYVFASKEHGMYRLAMNDYFQ